MVGGRYTEIGVVGEGTRSDIPAQLTFRGAGLRGWGAVQGDG